MVPFRCPISSLIIVKIWKSIAMWYVSCNINLHPALPITYRLYIIVIVYGITVQEESWIIWQCFVQHLSNLIAKSMVILQKNASDRIFCRYYSFIVYCANLRSFRDVVWAICEYMMMIIIGNSEYNNQVNI